jgi:hypothetical protein
VNLNYVKNELSRKVFRIFYIVWNGNNQVLDERLYTDLFSIKERMTGGTKFCALLVRDYSE